MVTFKNTNTFIANATEAIAAWDGAYVTSRLGTLAFSGTLAFNSVLRGGRGGILLMDQTAYTGGSGVTAAKFNLASNAILQGPSASIPGATAGTIGTGAQYIDQA